MVQQVLQPVVDKLEISRKGRRIGLHAFRHTVASKLLQTASAAVAQRQLRHADSATTPGIYGHVLGDDQREAMGQIESVPFGPAKPSETLGFQIAERIFLPRYQTMSGKNHG